MNKKINTAWYRVWKRPHCFSVIIEKAVLTATRELVHTNRSRQLSDIVDVNTQK